MQAASPKQFSAGQIIGTVFWDADRWILVDFLPERKLSDVAESRRALRDKSPMKGHIIFPHDILHAFTQHT
jgi:hypothetical protein